MSMISCRDCGKEISSSAASCPSCGAPQSLQNPQGNHALLGLVAGAVIGLVIGLTTFAGRGKLGTFMLIAVTAILAVVGLLAGKTVSKNE